MTKKGKQVLEFLLTTTLGASTSALMIHWLTAGMSSDFTLFLDSIMVPTFATLTYFSRDEVKQFIKTKNPELAKSLSSFLDFEEKNTKKKKRKKIKNRLKKTIKSAYKKTKHPHQQITIYP